MIRDFFFPPNRSPPYQILANTLYSKKTTLSIPGLHNHMKNTSSSIQSTLKCNHQRYLTLQAVFTHYSYNCCSTLQLHQSLDLVLYSQENERTHKSGQCPAKPTDTDALPPFSWEAVSYSISEFSSKSNAQLDIPECSDFPLSLINQAKPSHKICSITI